LAHPERQPKRISRLASAAALKKSRPTRLHGVSECSASKQYSYPAEITAVTSPCMTPCTCTTGATTRERRGGVGFVPPSCLGTDLVGGTRGRDVAPPAPTIFRDSTDTSTLGPWGGSGEGAESSRPDTEGAQSDSVLATAPACAASAYPMPTIVDAWRTRPVLACTPRTAAPLDGA